jgi:hypothetical protein
MIAKGRLIGRQASERLRMLAEMPILFPQYFTAETLLL